MPTPATVLVTGTFRRSDGSAARGRVIFQLDQPLTDAVGNVIVPATPITTSLDGTGAITVPLVPNDDPSLLPSRSTYTVKESIEGEARQYRIIVPGADETVSLTDLAPVGNPPEPASAYVLKTQLEFDLADVLSEAGADATTKANAAREAAISVAAGDATAKVNALISGAPGLLDTLDELAAALGDDANFASTVTTALAGKIPLTQRGAVNGVATLDSAGTIPDAQIPASIARDSETAAAVAAAVAALVNSAPGTLDTLGELATALTNDENTAAALATTVGKKMDYIVHGSTAGTARTGGATVVFWIGSVAPTNAVANDLWWDTANTLIKRYSGSAWAASGGSTFASLPTLGTDKIQFVSKSTVAADGNTGLSWGSAKATIQAAIDALPASGGTVYVAPGTYAPFSSDKVNLVIEGLGAGGQDSIVGLGQTVVDVSGVASWGADLGNGLSSDSFQGPELRRIAFKGDGTSLGGVRVTKFSNFRLDDLSVSGMTTGTGIKLVGSSASQYATIRDPRISLCKTGLDVVDVNGVRLFGGFIQYYAGGAPSVTAATVGISVGAGADTFRAFGTVLQFQETCVDISGSAAELHGCRYEAFNTAVKFKGAKGKLEGGDFDCSIIGGAGICVDIQNTATQTDVGAYTYGAVSPEPVRDAGTYTRRRDAIWVNIPIGTASATIGIPLIGLTPDNSGGTSAWKVRKCRLAVGSTAIAASGTDYWSADLIQRGGSSNTLKSVNSQGGWAQWAQIAIDPSTGTDATLNAGDNLSLTLAKTGAPSALGTASISLMLVPR